MLGLPHCGLSRVFAPNHRVRDKAEKIPRLVTHVLRGCQCPGRPEILDGDTVVELIDDLVDHRVGV
ncbi:unannotated protein [freshwater metagenome]|uniref:Unannotated protein n=1 Tax=freshwater metagenome TaxID=449393 RepID=A0A6J6KQG3_9ZZZZ